MKFLNGINSFSFSKRIVISSLHALISTSILKFTGISDAVTQQLIPEQSSDSEHDAGPYTCMSSTFMGQRVVSVSMEKVSELCYNVQ